MTGTSGKETNSTLIKVISMLMFTVTSLMSFSGVLQKITPYSFNWFGVYFVFYACYISINCFVLASAYMFYEEEFSPKRIIGMLLQVFIYSVIIFCVTNYCGLSKPSPSLVLNSFLPFSTGRYWFATLFIAMYLFSPFLNIAIKNMTKEQHQACIAVSLILFSVVPSIFVLSDAWNAAQGRSLVWFVTLYIIAAYYKRFPMKAGKTDRQIYLTIYLLCILLTTAALCFLPYVLNVIFGKNSYFRSIYEYNSVLTCTSSICIFIYLMQIPIKAVSYNLLHKISFSVFGTYLLIDNPALRMLLWNEIYPIAAYSDSLSLVPRILFYSTAIFAAGLVINFIISLLLSFMPYRPCPK